MLTFRIQRNYLLNRGAYFPEPELHEQKVFNVSRSKTLGFWRNQRLIIGDLATARALIRAAVQEYDFTRLKHPEITSLRLFQSMPQMLDTGLEIWRYSGSVQSIARESVMVMYNNGQVRALERNSSVGFSVIIRRARTPWSLDGWVQEEFRKEIVRSLATHQQTTRVPLNQALAVLDAERQQLVTEHALALAQLQTTYSDARYAEAVAAWDALVENEERRQIFNAMANNHRDTLVPLPLPTIAKVKELWKQSFINQFAYEEYVPFTDVALSAPGRKVTLNRGAMMTDSRMVITTNTTPRIDMVQIPNHHTNLQYMTYDQPNEAAVNVTITRPPARGGGGRPGGPPGSPHIVGWRGDATIPPGWTILTAKETPEPQLTVFPVPVSINRDVASLIQAAGPTQKPTLVAGALDRYPALPLVLPDLMVSMDLRPAVDSYLLLEPADPNFAVKGSVVQHNGFTPLVDRNVTGFHVKPISGRPTRTAILPDLFGS